MTDRSQDRYEVWTRRPVVYLPITLGANLVGYLWGSREGSAAGFFARAASGINHVKSSIYWHGKLDETYRLGLKPVEAISHWAGKPQDPQFGGIAADAELGAARTIQDLALQLNPDAPLGEGPWVQDGEYPSGAPADRSAGWGPLESVPTSTYPESADSPVRYLPIAWNGEVLGYLWAAAADNAAGYVQRAATGKVGMLAGGLWRSRLIDAFEAGLPASDVLQRLRVLPEYSPELFGAIDTATLEQQVGSLVDLQRLAEND
ncbi:hypothetical protein [Nocardia sp. NPDC056000]|uniref:hypothetical protein n=1 Tax=Nocardia sp. NPDC056000 TaxID=3345674 RepID=UPI0035D6C475